MAKKEKELSKTDKEILTDFICTEFQGAADCVLKRMGELTAEQEAAVTLFIINMGCNIKKNCLIRKDD